MKNEDMKDFGGVLACILFQETLHAFILDVDRHTVAT